MHYSVDMFTHNKAAKLFEADAAELTHGITNLRWMFKQIYPDACDAGLILINPDTGGESVWYISREVIKEGDLLMWILIPTPETCKKYPGLTNYTMKIYND
jgi:hypothetical protein